MLGRAYRAYRRAKTLQPTKTGGALQALPYISRHNGPWLDGGVGVGYGPPARARFPSVITSYISLVFGNMRFMRGDWAFWRIEESREQIMRLRDDADRWFGRWKAADRARVPEHRRRNALHGWAAGD